MIDHEDAIIMMMIVIINWSNDDDDDEEEGANLSDTNKFSDYFRSILQSFMK